MLRWVTEKGKEFHEKNRDGRGGGDICRARRYQYRRLSEHHWAIDPEYFVGDKVPHRHNGNARLGPRLNPIDVALTVFTHKVQLPHYLSYCELTLYQFLSYRI